MKQNSPLALVLHVREQLDVSARDIAIFVQTLQELPSMVSTLGMSESAMFFVSRVSPPEGSLEKKSIAIFAL